ncbi:MAG: IS66 family transposase [Planctomycetales bacterium]
MHALGPTEQTATAMGYFWRLFDLEDKLRELSDDARHVQRQLRSRPLLQEFKNWMDQQLATLRPRYDLRRAINYMTTRSECFERFLNFGDIPFDNNGSEQAVKNPMIGKKELAVFRKSRRRPGPSDLLHADCHVPPLEDRSVRVPERRALSDYLS